MSPGQLVGTESLSKASSSSSGGGGGGGDGGNFFVDHCSCIASAAAISFSASDYKSILKFSRHGHMASYTALLAALPFLPPDDLSLLEALVLEMNIRT